MSEEISKPTEAEDSVIGGITLEEAALIGFFPDEEEEEGPYEVF